MESRDKNRIEDRKSGGQQQRSQGSRRQAGGRSYRQGSFRGRNQQPTFGDFLEEQAKNARGTQRGRGGNSSSRGEFYWQQKQDQDRKDEQSRSNSSRQEPERSDSHRTSASSGHSSRQQQHKVLATVPFNRSSYASKVHSTNKPGEVSNVSYPGLDEMNALRQGSKAKLRSGSNSSASSTLTEGPRGPTHLLSIVFGKGDLHREQTKAFAKEKPKSKENAPTFEETTAIKKQILTKNQDKTALWRETLKNVEEMDKSKAKEKEERSKAFQALLKPHYQKAGKEIDPNAEQYLEARRHEKRVNLFNQQRVIDTDLESDVFIEDEVMEELEEVENVDYSQSDQPVPMDTDKQPEKEPVPIPVPEVVLLPSSESSSTSTPASTPERRHSVSSVVHVTPGFRPVSQSEMHPQSKSTSKSKPKVSESASSSTKSSGFKRPTKPSEVRPPSSVAQSKSPDHKKSKSDHPPIKPPESQVKKASGAQENQPSSSAQFQHRAPKKGKGKKQDDEEENQMVNRLPCIMEDKFRDKNSLKIVKFKVRYLVIDASYGSATLIKANKPTESAREAPDFVYVYQTNDDWRELRHTDFVFLKEFYRRLDLDGNPMPDQSRAMPADELEKVVPGSGTPPETSFEAAWVSTKIEEVQFRTNRNIIANLPALTVNPMAAKPLVTRRDGVTGFYRLHVDFIAGYFEKQQRARNRHINPIFTRMESNLTAAGEVIMLDVFRVQGNQFGKLGQCAVPLRLMANQNQLQVFPVGPILERVNPVIPATHNLLIRLGGIGDRIRTVDEFENVFNLYKHMVMLQIYAESNVELHSVQQSQVYVKFGKDTATGDTLFGSHHRTILRVHEQPSLSERVRKARAKELAGGCPIILRRAPTKRRNEPCSDEDDSNILKPAVDPSKYEYADTEIIWTGISTNTRLFEGQPWEISVRRSLYQSAASKALINKERRANQEAKVSQLIDRLNLNTEEERTKKKEEILAQLRNNSAIPGAELDEAVGKEDRPLPSRRIRPPSPQLTDEQRRKLREDEPEASDELYFENRNIGADSLMVLQGDERRRTSRRLKRAVENWPFVMNDNTFSAKIAAILAGIVNFPHDNEHYERITISRKLKWRHWLQIGEVIFKESAFRRIREDDRSIWQSDDEDSDTEFGSSGLQPRGSISLNDLIDKYVVKQRNRRRKVFHEFTKINNARTSHKLNKRQMNCIEHVSKGKPFVVIQAPGGTGKTEVLINAVAFQLDAKPGELVCLAAEQNEAVLNMMKVVTKVIPAYKGVKTMPQYSCLLIRSSAADMSQPIPEGMKENLEGFLLLDHLRHLVYDYDVDDDSEGLTNERKVAMKAFIDIMETDEFAMSDQMHMIRYVLRFSKELRIVGTTISNLLLLRNVINCTTLCIDEAGQSLASDIAIIIADSRIEQLIATGDQYQLEPYCEYVLKNKAYSFRQASLITVGCERMRHLPMEDRAFETLTQCFRFQKDLRNLCSFASYEEFSEALEAPPEENDRQKGRMARMNIPWPCKNVPILLIHTEDPAVNPDTKSYHNESHRRIAIQIQNLLNHFIIKDGVIEHDSMMNCYYLDEANKMESEIKKMPEHQQRKFDRVECNTVQHFQGGQKDINIIITSKDRLSEKENKLQSHLLDCHQFTTASSRGSQCTAIIGNFNTLTDLRFGALFRYIIRARLRGVPILNDKFLTYALNRIANSKNPPNKIRWHYDNGNNICEGNDSIPDFYAKTWINNVRSSYHFEPTPRSRITNIVMPEPIKIQAPNPFDAPPAERQQARQQEQPVDADFANFANQGWGSNSNIPETFTGTGWGNVDPNVIPNAEIINAVFAADEEEQEQDAEMLLRKASERSELDANLIEAANAIDIGTNEAYDDDWDGAGVQNQSDDDVHSDWSS